MITLNPISEFHNPPGVALDFDLLQRFESNLQPLAPEVNEIPCRVLGYGEISTVFELQVAGFEGLALKRMSVFERPRELEAYLVAYRDYHTLLSEEIGIALPEHGYAAFAKQDGRPVFYIIQQKVPSAAIGNKLLHRLAPAETVTLFEAVLRALGKVHAFNESQSRYEVALDGQISNWALADFDPEQAHFEREPMLIYFDTSTPLLRVQGVEQLDPELFLRAAPSFLRWVLRRFFLQDVMDRYYDLRQVIVDLLANLYKEQLSPLIPDFIITANTFLREVAGFLDMVPITEKEVRDYYREDKTIWSLYLSARRLDRFLQARLLRRQYHYILPGKITR